MDDISVSAPALLSRRDSGRRSRDAAAWAGACVLSACTIAALVPPAWYVWLLAGRNGSDGLANHAHHVAAAEVAMLMILFPAGGAALGGLATLLSRRPVPVAQRASAMAGGAFLTSLVLTTSGFLWLLAHAQFTF